METATSYIYRYKKTSERTWGTEEEVDVSDVLITQLENGISYDFQVWARNSGGDGPAVSGSATTNPAAPASVRQVAGTANSLNFDWDDMPGAESYIYQYREQGELDWGAEHTANASSVALTNLKAGTSYELQVKSRNAGGDSSYTEPIEGLTAPDAPTNLVASIVADRSIIFDWDDMPGATEYRYQSKKSSVADWSPFNPIRTTLTSRAGISGLDELTAYDFRVLARNATGDSDWVYADATTTAPVPDTPTNLAVASVSTTSVTLTWNSGRWADAYDYQYREKDAVDSNGNPVDWEAPVEVSEATATIGSLATDTPYEFRVRARNAEGASDYTDPPVTGTPRLGAPPVPIRLEVVFIDPTEITLDWDDMPDAESYTYQYREVGELTWSAEVEVTESTVVITDLTEDVEYEFRVSAKNDIGQSMFSQSVSETARFVSPFVVGGGLWGSFKDDEEDPHFWKDDLAWVIGALMFGVVVGGVTSSTGGVRNGPLAAFIACGLFLAVGVMVTRELTPLTIGFFVFSGIGAGFSFFVIAGLDDAEREDRQGNGHGSAGGARAGLLLQWPSVGALEIPKAWAQEMSPTPNPGSQNVSAIPKPLGLTVFGWSNDFEPNRSNRNVLWAFGTQGHRRHRPVWGLPRIIDLPLAVQAQHRDHMGGCYG